MAELQKAYRRLPGRGLRHTGPIAVMRISSRLFLGADHLLCVDSTGYSEEYRRFYYADIQAILVQKTDRGKHWNRGLAIVAGVTAFLAIGLSGIPTITFGSIAGCCLLFLLINLSRGPTCQAQLHTAVHVEELPSLNRLRVARKVLAILKPEIDQAQGVMAPEEMAARLATPQDATGLAAAPTANLQRRPPIEAQATHTFGSQGRFHRIVFSLLLVDAAESIVGLFVRHVSLSLLGSVLMGGLAISTILALVGQQGSALSRAVKGVTWATLAYMLVNFTVGYVFFITLSVKHPELGNDQWRYLQMMSELSPWESPWLLGLYLYSIVGSLSFGLLGLVALHTQSQPHSPGTLSEQAPLPAPAPAQDTPSPSPD